MDRSCVVRTESSEAPCTRDTCPIPRFGDAAAAQPRSGSSSVAASSINSAICGRRASSTEQIGT